MGWTKTISVGTLAAASDPAALLVDPDSELALAATVTGGAGWPPQRPPVGFAEEPGYVGNIAGSGLDDTPPTIVSGQTYYYLKNPVVGTPASPVNNVTFIGCLWDGQGTNAAALAPAVDGDVTFEYCTWRPEGLTDSSVQPDGVDGYQYALVADGTAASPGTWNGFIDGSLTVRNCHMWGYGNATKVEGSTQANPFEFYDTVVESPRLNNNPAYDDHTDGIGSPGGGSNLYFVIDGCWVLGPNGDTNGLAFQNTPSAGNYDNMTVTRSVIAGWGNAIQISQGSYPTIGSPPFLTFTDNVLWCKWQPILSPLYDSAIVGGTGTVWSGNKVWVEADSEWGAVAQDGLFWLPVANQITGTGSAALAPFVSATDYGG